jgi:transposase
MDAGYDFVPIYQQLFRMNVHSVIAYNKCGEEEIAEFDI